MIKKKYHILVIDDDPVVLKTVASYLSEEYIVGLAKSGEMALRFLEREDVPDLILLDIDMPVINGFAVLKELKNKEKTANIPVVFLTGLLEEENEIRGLELGAMDYIRKPVSRAVLLARVRLHITANQRFCQRGQFDEEKASAIAVPLSNRELETARLLALFYSNEKICQTLHISMSYTKKLVAAVLNKLDLDNRDDIRKFLR